MSRLPPSVSPAGAVLRASLLAVVCALLAACPPSPRDEAPTGAPVILVPPTATPSEAVPVVTPTPAPTPAPVAAPAPTGSQEKSEDMVYNLGGFDPLLSDAPNDQKGKEASTDLTSAHAVIDKDRMYVRLALREEMPKDPPAEVRFWLEQEKPLVTVEVKLGTRDRPCELSSVQEGGEETVVPNCYHDGNPLDLSFPLSSIPGIDVAKPFHVSGFQTCCMDEARNDPFDEIPGAQEVFRVGWDATGDAGDASP